jgi:hypothetical protein
LEATVLEATVLQATVLETTVLETTVLEAKRLGLSRAFVYFGHAGGYFDNSPEMAVDDIRPHAAPWRAPIARPAHTPPLRGEDIPRFGAVGDVRMPYHRAGDAGDV